MSETPWEAGQCYLWWTMVREEGYSYSWLLSTKAWRADLSITSSLYASVKHLGRSLSTKTSIAGIVPFTRYCLATITSYDM
ncbi:hypothetical protein BDZ94DRAFT_1275176 [Collybia nuda]|uniref:Uncharacterized protein n=1 Tax=Collybia nuda TaxID=64659 RepID=A0A9P5XS79_9AGAR|nr:hypothetical protein BDZ94DRAFT_1275176 [Collybia nuda]